MKTARPAHLTDTQLIDALNRCAREERGATASLVAHLAEMDVRELHLGLGFSSLYAYCLQVLRLSESATCKRIDVARAARRHPAILDRLADGSLSLTTARLIAPHLTESNHEELIAAAAGLGMRAVEQLIARRFPRPDVATLIRKLPVPAAQVRLLAEAPPDEVPAPEALTAPSASAVEGGPMTTPLPAAPTASTTPSSRPARPTFTALSADRYQVRFTASASTCRKLRLARDLLRHAVPSGDLAEIVDRALTALIDDIARKKCAAATKVSRHKRSLAADSRRVPAEIRREVWKRDQGMCAFVGRGGRRCRSRAFLEFHHVMPYAVGGGAGVSNIQLRCRAHNAYEAKLFYGPHRLSGSGSTGRAAG